MLLTMSSVFPHSGNATHFKQMIAQPTELDSKNHSIRALTHGTKRRWRPGMKIHFWMGNPRNKKGRPWIHDFTPDYKAFHGEDPIVQATEDVAIYTSRHNEKTCRAVVYIGKRIEVTAFRDFNQEGPDLATGNIPMISRLAKNDGFKTVDDFLSYFHYRNHKGLTTLFKGQIIHWTKGLLYDKRKAQTIEDPKQKWDTFASLLSR